MSLTAMQELFVRALLSDPKRNATAAVISAGYSPKRAKITARELMKDPDVSCRVHPASCPGSLSSAE
jgi:phage terminase small subunit